MPNGTTEFEALYQRGPILGRGACGVAFIVRPNSDPELQLVAKEICIVRTDEKRRRDAIAECQMLTRLSHRNIVACTDVFIDDEMMYIVMEYANGGDLARHIQARRSEDRGRFSEHTVMSVFVQICSALSYLHSRKILHRDLKPANVFVVGEGDLAGCSVKLGDFGIAKVIEATMGQAHSSVGTPSYLSPEICKNHPYGIKSDVWALGVVLYELVCLKVPFHAGNLPAMALMICTTDPKPLPEEYGAPLVALADSLLQKEPTKRPPVSAVLQNPYVQSFVAEDTRAHSAGEVVPSRHLAAVDAATMGLGSTPALMQTSHSAGAMPEVYSKSALARGNSMPTRHNRDRDGGNPRLPSCGPSGRPRHDKFLLSEPASHWCWPRQDDKVRTGVTPRTDGAPAGSQSSTSSTAHIRRALQHSDRGNRVDRFNPTERVEPGEQRPDGRFDRDRLGGLDQGQVERATSDNLQPGSHRMRADRGERGDRLARGERGERPARSSRGDRAELGSRGSHGGAASSKEDPAALSDGSIHHHRRRSRMVEHRASSCAVEIGGGRSDHRGSGGGESGSNFPWECTAWPMEFAAPQHAQVGLQVAEKDLPIAESQQPCVARACRSEPNFQGIVGPGESGEFSSAADISGCADTDEDLGGTGSCDGYIPAHPPPTDFAEPFPPGADPPSGSSVLTALLARDDGHLRVRRGLRRRGRPPLLAGQDAQSDADVRSPTRTRLTKQRIEDIGSSPGERPGVHPAPLIALARSVSPANRELPAPAALRPSGSAPSLPPLPPVLAPGGKTVRSRSVANLHDGRSSRGHDIAASSSNDLCQRPVHSDSGDLQPTGAPQSQPLLFRTSPLPASSDRCLSDRGSGPNQGPPAPSLARSAQQALPPQRQGVPHDPSSSVRVARDIAARDLAHKLPATMPLSVANPVDGRPWREQPSAAAPPGRSDVLPSEGLLDAESRLYSARLQLTSVV